MALVTLKHSRLKPAPTRLSGFGAPELLAKLSYQELEKEVQEAVDRLVKHYERQGEFVFSLTLEFETGRNYLPRPT